MVESTAALLDGDVLASAWIRRMASARQPEVDAATRYVLWWRQPGVEVVADEERVHAGQLRVREAVALAPAEGLERAERGPEVIGVVPRPLLVGLDQPDVPRGVEVAVVLHHQYA